MASFHWSGITRNVADANVAVMCRAYTELEKRRKDCGEGSLSPGRVLGIETSGERCMCVCEPCWKNGRVSPASSRQSEARYHLQI
jgi:hypothetical protein